MFQGGRFIRKKISLNIILFRKNSSKKGKPAIHIEVDQKSIVDEEAKEQMVVYTLLSHIYLIYCIFRFYV